MLRERIEELEMEVENMRGKASFKKEKRREINIQEDIIRMEEEGNNNEFEEGDSF